MKRPQIYYLQNRAIHQARAQLEEQGILDPWAGVAQIREMAAEINLGIASISKLSLNQRQVLIDKLNAMGAQVRNPHIYQSDLEEERRQAGTPGPRKVLLFAAVKEEQLRLLDSLANKIAWRETDGYLRLCHRLLKAPRPRNSKEVTKLRLTLESMINQTSVHSQNNSSPPPVL